MEKFGLFDLIEKFNSPSSAKSELGNSAADNGKTAFAADISGTPPQFMMNAKMREFILRHETISAEIKANALKKPKRKKNAANKPSQTKKADKRPSAPKKKADNQTPAPKKKRGRPPKIKA